MRYFFILLIMMISGAAHAQTFGETRKYFRDWLASCRPDGYCSATTYDNPNPGDGSVADYILRVGRHERGVYWEISLTTVATMPEQYSDMNIDINGQTSILSQNFDYGAYASINDFFFVSSNAQVILDRLIQGARARFTFDDQNLVPQTASFSLSGLAASLLWIDEQQRRVGAERVAYPAPLGLTPVSQGYSRNVPRTLIEKRAVDEDCEAFEDLAGAYRVIVGQIEENWWLYLLPCTSGAYNFFYKAYEGNADYTAPLYFAEYDSFTGWRGTAFLTNPAFDENTKILTSYYLGRGLGDCGDRGMWQWGESGLVMLEYRYKGDCDAQGEPGEFPLIFELNAPPPPGKAK